MDVALHYADKYVFTPHVYPESWSEDNMWRQLLSLNIIVDLGGVILYLLTAGMNYTFIFDKRILKHPQILEVRRNIIEGVTQEKLLKLRSVL